MKRVHLIFKLDVVTVYLDMKVPTAVTVPEVLSGRGINVLVSGCLEEECYHSYFDKCATKK